MFNASFLKRSEIVVGFLKTYKRSENREVNIEIRVYWTTLGSQLKLIPYVNYFDSQLPGSNVVVACS